MPSNPLALPSIIIDPKELAKSKEAMIKTGGNQISQDKNAKTLLTAAETKKDDKLKNANFPESIVQVTTPTVQAQIIVARTVPTKPSV